MLSTDIVVTVLLFLVPISQATMNTSYGNDVASMTTVDMLALYTSGGCNTPLIVNGKFNVDSTSASNAGSGNFTTGDTVEVVCDVGYKFVHTESPSIFIVCKDGMWTNLLGTEYLPLCQPVNGCAVPRVANGDIIPQSKFMPGDHAKVVCHSGYYLSPRDAQSRIRCNSDGSWGSFNDAPLSCEVDAAQGCQRPLTISNGGYHILPEVTSTLSFFPSGSRIVFYCNNGYRFATNEPPVAVCNNGQWHRSASSHISCQLRRQSDRCGSVADVPHARHYVMQSVLTEDEDARRRIAGGTFSHGTKVVFYCEDGYHQVGSSMVECDKGQWIGGGLKCLRHNGCSSKPPTVANAEYSIYSNRENVNRMSGDDVDIVATDGSVAYYFCRSGFRLSDTNATALACRDGEWNGEIPRCEKRLSCDAPMNVENAVWVVGWVWGDYRAGAVARYTCSPGFMLVGEEAIMCQANGFWSDNPPQCLVQDDYCHKPDKIDNGFYVCKPSDCRSTFHIGAEVYYFCRQGFQARPANQKMTCLPGGLWKGDPPTCSKVETDDAVFFPERVVSSPFTVVVSTSCTMIGVLMIIIMAVMLRWLRVRRSRRLQSTEVGQMQDPALLAPPYSVAPGHVGSELDRLALIAFADDAFALPAASLPTYEEAIRVGGGTIYTYANSEVLRNTPAGFSRSGRGGEYRPLASVSHQLGQCGTPTNDQRRNSIVTMASNNLSAGLSAGFGSIDTINIAGASDATSTSVTVNTYDSMASNPSIAASQRAACGSMESSSTRGSLASDAAPLLDHRNAAAGIGPVVDYHDSAVATDTLRSQTSRSLHSDNASRIVELPEEQKDD